MNPYDFVPLDMSHQPQKKQPVWHHTLTGSNTSKLYSGSLELYIKAMTPIFIRHADSSMQDPNKPAQHIYNQDGYYIIPGTSIKGLLRTVVETLCRGCMTVFHQPREYRHNPVPSAFAACQDNNSLCLSCRLFGMMPSEQRNARVFLGKVNIGDAVAYEYDVPLYDAIYTAVLDSPKPRHRAFYLDAASQNIAGRKYYFHHDDEPRTENRLIPIGNTGKFRNQHIQPLDTGAEFHARLDFTNLEADEFAALLYAITMQSDMCHKIGYGKPIGLGSVWLQALNLTLVDYRERYTSLGGNGGITRFGEDELTDLCDEQFASHDAAVSRAWNHFLGLPSLAQLHAIWQWPPNNAVTYFYPPQNWFHDNPTAPISSTRNLRP